MPSPRLCLDWTAMPLSPGFDAQGSPFPVLLSHLHVAPVSPASLDLPGHVPLAFSPGQGAQHRAKLQAHHSPALKNLGARPFLVTREACGIRMTTPSCQTEEGCGHTGKALLDLPRAGHTGSVPSRFLHKSNSWVLQQKLLGQESSGHIGEAGGQAALEVGCSENY